MVLLSLFANFIIVVCNFIKLKTKCNFGHSHVAYNETNVRNIDMLFFPISNPNPSKKMKFSCRLNVLCGPSLVIHYRNKIYEIFYVNIYAIQVCLYVFLLFAKRIFSLRIYSQNHGNREITWT